MSPGPGGGAGSPAGGPEAAPGEPGRRSGPPVLTTKPVEERWPEELDDEARAWGTIARAAGLFLFIGPLVVWAMKKDAHKYADVQGKEGVNFGLTVAIAMMALWFVEAVLGHTPMVGRFMWPVIWMLGMVSWGVYIFNLVVVIIGAMKAHEGIVYRAPLCLRLVP